MIKRILFLLTIGIILVGGIANAQESDLFMSHEVQKAYEEGTRSYTGAPGKHYFRNTASYDIEARFDPETGIIEGEETILLQDQLNLTMTSVIMMWSLPCPGSIWSGPLVSFRIPAGIIRKRC